MDPVLAALAADALTRLEVPGSPLPELPQLLAAGRGRVLLRDRNGLRELPLAELPIRLDLAPLIDHTLLKATATAAEIANLCEEARTWGFASVCVNPAWVPDAVRALQGTRSRVCTVVGFPLGATTPAAKAAEAREALAEGAQEIDMVLALGRVKGGDWEGVQRDLAAVRGATAGACLKLILETCLLDDAEIDRACALAVDLGLDFVKTSTGFSSGGATTAAVARMRTAVGDRCGVKASGGIRSTGDALEMVLAGATRLGLSCGVAVARGGRGEVPEAGKTSAANGSY